MALSRQIKVGLFVFTGLASAAALVFMIGDNRMMFDSKVDFKAYFRDVQGLQRGSTVRMGGVDIGTVTRVNYLQDPAEQRIEVILSVVRREADRVRRDSEVTVAGKGMLGDKMLVVSSGTASTSTAVPGQELSARETQDMGALIDEMSGKAENLMNNLERATAPFADEALQQDLRASVHALSTVLTSLASGPGYAARLLHSAHDAEQISALVGELEHSTREARSLLEGLNQIVDRINRGPGLAHDVFYGQQGEATLAAAGKAAQEFALLLQGVREGKGVAHDLLFGHPAGAGGAGADAQAATMDQGIADLAGAARDLHAILSDVRAGKGTLGALLVDPSVYEDMKLLLGNVERNRVLRALVRYAIARDEARPVEVVDPPRTKTER
jgi:phospholipid/cholesterol/gamma-HCH transport system substrate-binding protein